MNDSQVLCDELSEQAENKYRSIDFQLGKLTEHGQRISIRITLQRKNTAEVVSFVSGWMLYPDGKIILTTPYGGK